MTARPLATPLAVGAPVREASSEAARPPLSLSASGSASVAGSVTVCPICKLPYGRTYEEHTGSQTHKDAVWLGVRGVPSPAEPPAETFHLNPTVASQAASG